MCRQRIHARTRPTAHERTRAFAHAHQMPSAGPWRRAWRSESTRSTCSSTTISTSSTTPTSTFSQHHAAGGLGDNPRHRQRRQQDGQQRQREQPPAELQLAACLLVQHCTGCARAACFCSTARRRVWVQHSAQHACQKQLHAFLQLSSLARSPSPIALGRRCMTGYCICMLVIVVCHVTCVHDRLRTRHRPRRMRAQ